MTSGRQKHLELATVVLTGTAIIISLGALICWLWQAP
jgi:hypothetical protein